MADPDLPQNVQKVLDEVAAYAEELEKLLTEKLGYAKVTAYVDGVAKIEISWKSLLLLKQLVLSANDGVPQQA